MRCHACVAAEHRRSLKCAWPSYDPWLQQALKITSKEPPAFLSGLRGTGPLHKKIGMESIGLSYPAIRFQVGVMNNMASGVRIVRKKKVAEQVGTPINQDHEKLVTMGHLKPKARRKCWVHMLSRR